MNHKNSDYKQIFLGVLILVIPVYLFYTVIIAFINVFPKLNKDVIVALGAAMISIFSILLSKYLENKRNFELELRNKKIPSYQNFIDFIFQILNNKLSIEDDSAFNNLFMDVTKELMIWGSDKVILKWSHYRVNTNSDDSLVLLEDLIYEIRKDVGHKNQDLKQYDILSLFINDIHKLKDKDKTK